MTIVDKNKEITFYTLIKLNKKFKKLYLNLIEYIYYLTSYLLIFELWAFSFYHERFIYSFESPSYKEGDKEILHLLVHCSHGHHSQDWGDRSQELGTLSISSMWVPKAHIPEPFAAFPRPSAKSWIRNGIAGTKTCTA